MPWIQRLRWFLVLAFAICAAGCQALGSPSAGNTAGGAALDSAELRDVLAELARAHDQKLQLAFYVSLPFNGVDRPFQPFYANMGRVQRDLLADLEAWAKAHQVSLVYRFNENTAGKGLKIMEARQERLTRSASRADFPRDTLMLMYADYEWQISLVQALLPVVSDPDLRAYLEKSLKVHEDGSAEILGLLRQFKYAG